MTMNKLAFFLFVTLLALGSACSNAQKNNQTQHNSTKAMFQNLNPNQFAQGMTQANAVIIDVRTPQEYREGHIKNAKLIDIYSNDFENQINQLDKSKAYYVYCRSGARSSNASRLMIEKGFTQVYNLQGGIGAWAGAGQPIER